MEAKLKRRRWGLYIAASSALIIPYSLSWGPVYYAVTEQYLPPVILRIYWPLGWVSDRSPTPLCTALEWSLRLYLPYDPEDLME